MVSQNIFIRIVALVTFAVSGCSTQMSAKVINQDLYHPSNHYVVVNNPKSNKGGADGEIVSALGNYGISAEILSEKEARESRAAVIVTYQDWYKWDIVQYLWTLDIYFNDAEMKPFAHANFHHGGLHNFPNRRDMVSDLIDKIMSELGSSKPSKGETYRKGSTTNTVTPHDMTISSFKGQVEKIGIEMHCIDSIQLESKGSESENWLLDCGDGELLKVKCFEDACYVKSK